MLGFFDTLILMGITITFLPGVILLLHRTHNQYSWEHRHKHLSLALSSVLLFGFALLFWGSFVEPRLIVTRHVTIPLATIESPFTIAVIADYQVGRFKKTNFVRQSVEKVIAHNPDIVTLVGDHIDNSYYHKEEVEYLSPLTRLATLYPTYAVHGNHEYGIGKHIKDVTVQSADMSDHVRRTMESYGIIYLQNDTIRTTLNGQDIYLFGGDEVWMDRLDFTSLTTIQDRDDIPVIALIHNPAYLYGNYPEGIDLAITGHTHGGQIRLPFIGPLGTVDTLIPRYLYQGLHIPKRAGEYLYVTSGIGESNTRARLFNPPEIVFITLTPLTN